MTPCIIPPRHPRDDTPEARVCDAMLRENVTAIDVLHRRAVAQGLNPAVLLFHPEATLWDMALLGPPGERVVLALMDIDDLRARFQKTDGTPAGFLEFFDFQRGRAKGGLLIACFYGAHVFLHTGQRQTAGLRSPMATVGMA